MNGLISLSVEELLAILETTDPALRAEALFADRMLRLYRMSDELKRGGWPAIEAEYAELHREVLFDLPSQPVVGFPMFGRPLLTRFSPGLLVRAVRQRQEDALAVLAAVAEAVSFAKGLEDSQ